MKKFNQFSNEQIDEITMSDGEYARGVESYGKRATNLLKHSWSQSDAAKEKEKAGDKEGAAKTQANSSRAHKLFLKAKERHLRDPERAEAYRKKIMSGASQDYKDQEKKRGIGHVRDSVELSGNAINEISKQLRDRYVQRAVTAHGGYNMARRNTTGDEKKHWERKEKNTQTGISRALSDKRLAKEESSDACRVCGQTPCNCTHINEVSKKVLGSYISKAIDDKEMHATASSFVAGRHGTNPYNDAETSKRESNRAAGIKKALARLTKEDIEQQSKENVNELKVSTLLRYTTKANKSALKHDTIATRSRDEGDMDAWAKHATKADKRDKGIRVASFKMHKQLNKGK